MENIKKALEAYVTEQMKKTQKAFGSNPMPPVLVDKVIKTTVATTLECIEKTIKSATDPQILPTLLLASTLLAGIGCEDACPCKECQEKKLKARVSDAERKAQENLFNTLRSQN